MTHDVPSARIQCGNARTTKMIVNTKIILPANCAMVLNALVEVAWLFFAYAKGTLAVCDYIIIIIIILV